MHTVMATFRVRRGREAELAAVLDRHHARIVTSGYGGSTRPVRLLGTPDDGPVLYEIFDWKEGAVSEAARDPAVLAIWREIDGLCEARPGGPATDFPRVERLEPGTS